MKMKWTKKRCSRCERLILVKEFPKGSSICTECLKHPVYPIEFIRKQVLIHGNVKRVAKMLELDVEIIRQICGMNPE